MLKIYQAYTRDNDVQIMDEIRFNYGRFDTGLNGYGKILAGNRTTITNYEMRSLRSFKKYLETVEIEDGYPKDFMLFNPIAYGPLNDKYSYIPRCSDTYKHRGLDEEAILLFTKYVYLSYPDDGLVQKLFGREAGNGMYLLMPNAFFSMAPDPLGAYDDYEVLQSQRIGKRLVLTKFDRRI